MTIGPGHTLAGPETEYRQRRAHFDSLLTLFGRKPVLEALRSAEVQPVRLHLANSNRDSVELREMRAIARRRHVEIVEHSRRELSRISKNGKQDQGVAADIEAPCYLPIERLLEDRAGSRELLAVDAVTNPQNLGMIVRTVAASPMHGLIIPRRGCARIDGLVIKASAGTLFKCRIYHCDRLVSALAEVREAGYRIVGLDSRGDLSIKTVPNDHAMVFVLGNETSGISAEVNTLCEQNVRIPLANGVDSLNVSVAAALVAFRSIVGCAVQP